MTAKKTGRGQAPATCGELVQGQFARGENFLVTLPVDLWSRVTIEFDENLNAVHCQPVEKTKSCRAVRLLLEKFQSPQRGALLTFETDIPIGKGMASSTADISAACRAVGDALGQPVPPALISDIAREVEPSDGNMYPGVVCYDHVACRLIERLGPPPPAALLVVDLGGQVDTLAYNQHPKSYTPADFSACTAAYQMVREGVRAQDLSQIGAGATASARLNQKFLYKSSLEALIEIGTTSKAYGVCIGHSGTIAALIFEPGSPGIASAKDQAVEVLPAECRKFTTSTLTAQEETAS